MCHQKIICYPSSSGLLEHLGSDVLLEVLDSLDCKYHIESQIIPHSITWKRKIFSGVPNSVSICIKTPLIAKETTLCLCVCYNWFLTLLICFSVLEGFRSFRVASASHQRELAQLPINTWELLLKRFEGKLSNVFHIEWISPLEVEDTSMCKVLLCGLYGLLLIR